MLRQIFRDIAQLKVQTFVGFTGGEPFSVEDLLFYGIKLARTYGIPYGITTNANWGSSPEKRHRVIDSIGDCSRLGLSSDRFHAKFVSPSSVGRTLRRALAACIPAKIRYTLTAGETEDDALRSLDLIDTKFKQHVVFGDLQSVGRATRLPEALFPAHRVGPCLAASVTTIRANGDVFGCCGESFYLPGSHDLLLGNVKQHPLEELLNSRNKNVVLQAVRTLGPLRMVTESGIGTDKFRAKVLSMSQCGSCRLLLGTEDSCRVTRVWAKTQQDRIRALRALFYGEITE